MKSLILGMANRYDQARNRVFNKFNSPIIVLMYHRVTDDVTADYTVSTANFQDQMRYIKQHFELLRFEDDWSRVNKPSCVVTFDDGYYYNYLISKDFLEKEEIPATFFITTQNIETEALFWWDEIVLHKDSLEKQTGKTLDQLFKQLKNNKPAEQSAFLKQYRPHYATAPIPAHHYRSMNKAELAELAELQYTTIGVHTVNHPKLSLLDCEEMFFELNESKKTIEEITNIPMNVCSFPYGSYNRETLEICRRIGFEKTAVTGFSRNCYTRTNPFKIPRFSVGDDEISVFREKIERQLR